MSHEDDQELTLFDGSEGLAAEPEVPMNIPVLVEYSQGGISRLFEITTAKTKIGRGANCDIVIEDPGVSREHAVIERHEAGRGADPYCTLRDNGSANGVWVNDVRVNEPVRLENDARIRMGRTLLGFLYRKRWEIERHGKIAGVVERYGGQVRRARVPCHLKSRLQIVSPDETFTPRIVHGHVADLDAGGVRFVTTEITRALWSSLLRGRSFIRCELAFEDAGTPLLLRSRMVWSHYNTNEQPNTCAIGLAFEELDPQARALLDRKLQEIAPEM